MILTKVDKEFVVRDALTDNGVMSQQRHAKDIIYRYLHTLRDHTIFRLLSRNKEILCPSRMRNKIPRRRHMPKRLARPTLQPQNLHLPPLWRKIHQLDPPITRNRNKSFLPNEIIWTVSALHIGLTDPLIATLAQFTRHMDFLVVVQPADTDDAITHFVGCVVSLFETTFRGEELAGCKLVGVDVLFPDGDCAEIIDDSEE